MARYVDSMEALVKRTQASVARKVVESPMRRAIEHLHYVRDNAYDMCEGGKFRYWVEVPAAANKYGVYQEQLMLAWANEFNEVHEAR